MSKPKPIEEQKDKAIQFCPKCKGLLKLYQCVRECTVCKNRFFILRTFKVREQEIKMDKQICEACKQEVNDLDFVSLPVRGGGRAIIHLKCLHEGLIVNRDSRVTEIRMTYRNPDLD